MSVPLQVLRDGGSQEPEVKNLGVILETDLIFSSHVKAVTNQHTIISKTLQKSNGLGPKYIADMLTKYKPNHRTLGLSQLEIPRVHTKQGESAFSYYA